MGQAGVRYRGMAIRAQTAPLWGGLSTQGGYGPGRYPTWTGRLLGGYWAVTGRLLGGYITGVVGHPGLFNPALGPSTKNMTLFQRL